MPTFFRREKRQELLLFSVLFLPSVVGQVSYTVPEEMQTGSLIGNVAHDLGLDVKRLKSGNGRIYSGDSRNYVELNILITVLDVNDNAPVFTQPVYKATVAENALKDSVVVSV
uniref:Cadherin domain-containing protein n=1 Tax=Oryzias sinensis TaxID=183150 RepID=A0A8C7WUL8_9TELE